MSSPSSRPMVNSKWPNICMVQLYAFLTRTVSEIMYKCPFMLSRKFLLVNKQELYTLWLDRSTLCQVKTKQLRSLTIAADKDIEDIVVTIPFSRNCNGTNLTSKVGTVVFDEVTKVQCYKIFLKLQTCKWRIPQLPKNVTPILEGGFSFDPAHPPAKPTVSVTFVVCLLLW